MLQLPHVSSRGALEQYRQAEIHASSLIQNTDKLTNHVYSNVLIPNDTASSLRAEYSTTQDIPLLSDMQDYKVKISRLKIPMTEVPLFQFKEDAYQIGFAWQPIADDASAYFSFIGGLETVQFRNIVANTNQIRGINPYDSAVFNIQDFLGMVNAVLAASWNTGVAAAKGAGVLDAAWDEDIPPFFRYDCEKNCIEFCQPVMTLDIATPYVFSINNECGTGTNKFRLLMSEELFSFFNGFQYDWYGVNGVTNDGGATWNRTLNYGLAFGEHEPITLTAIGNCPQQDYICTPQTTNSIYSFQRVSRIIITTNLALVKESVLVSQESSGNPLRFEILTDFEIPPANNINHNEPIYYFGDDSDRFYNIKDSGPLYKLELAVYLQWKDGTRTALYIAPGETAYIKLHFERKFANDNYQISDRNRYSQSGF